MPANGRLARVGGRWVQQGLIELAGVDRVLHAVIDVEDLELGAVVAVLLDVLALDDREGLLAAGFVPAEGRSVGGIIAARSAPTARPARSSH